MKKHSSRHIPTFSTLPLPHKFSVPLLPFLHCQPTTSQKVFSTSTFSSPRSQNWPSVHFHSSICHLDRPENSQSADSHSYIFHSLCVFGPSLSLSVPAEIVAGRSDAILVLVITFAIVVPESSVNLLRALSVICPVVILVFRRELVALHSTQPSRQQGLQMPFLCPEGLATLSYGRGEL